MSFQKANQMASVIFSQTHLLPLALCCICTKRISHGNQWSVEKTNLITEHGRRASNHFSHEFAMLHSKLQKEQYTAFNSFFLL